MNVAARSCCIGRRLRAVSAEGALASANGNPRALSTLCGATTHPLSPFFGALHDASR